MKDKKQLKRGLICVGIIAMELLIYFGISRYIAGIKAEEARLEASTYRTQNEFLKTVDCAPIFDIYPEQSFKVTFEICSTKVGEVQMYQQNGTKARYYFEPIVISVTEDFTEVCLTVNPELKDENEKESFLAFYGEYGSGIIPTVRDIDIEVVE